MITGLTPEECRAFLSDFMEVHELVRQYGGKWCQRNILPYLPVAASRGLLFSASNGSRIIGMMIAGPTNKPTGRDNFCAEGKLLFCYDWLVHPDYRDPKVLHSVNRELKNQAHERFPYTESFCYLHHDKYVLHKIKRGGVCVSEAVEPMTSAEDATEPSISSRSPMKDRSVVSRSLQSSTSS
jgi:hypothetical protein